MALRRVSFLPISAAATFWPESISICWLCRFLSQFGPWAWRHRDRRTRQTHPPHFPHCELWLFTNRKLADAETKAFCYFIHIRSNLYSHKNQLISQNQSVQLEVLYVNPSVRPLVRNAFIVIVGKKHFTINLLNTKSWKLPYPMFPLIGRVVPCKRLWIPLPAFSCRREFGRDALGFWRDAVQRPPSTPRTPDAVRGRGPLPIEPLAAARRLRQLRTWLPPTCPSIDLSWRWDQRGSSSIRPVFLRTIFREILNRQAKKKS